MSTLTVVVVVLWSLSVIGRFTERVLPALADFLTKVLPLLSDRVLKRAIRLAKAKR